MGVRIDKQYLISYDNNFIFNLDDLYIDIDKWLPTMIVVAGNDMAKNIVNAYNIKESKILSITTKTGYSICLSPDQEICVLTPTPSLVWCKARDIKCGQWIVIQLGTPSFFSGNELDLNIVPKNEVQEELWQNYPQRMTIDLAEWIGYFMADGFVIRKEDCDWVGMVIDYADDGRVEAHLLELSRKLFGLDSPIENREDLRGYDIYHGQRRAFYWPTTVLADWIIEFLDNTYDRIPARIIRAGKDYICAFLRGYFTAKCEPLLTKKIRAYSTNYNFLHHMQTVLTSMGIVAPIHVGATRVVSNRREYLYNLSISTIKGKKLFAKHISFFDSRQKDTLNNKEFIKDKLDLIPYEIIEPVEKYISECSLLVCANSRTKVNTILKSNAYIINKYAIMEVINKNQFYDQVVSIEYSKKPYLVVDFGFENGNSYLINNFILKGV